MLPTALAWPEESDGEDFTGAAEGLLPMAPKVAYSYRVVVEEIHIESYSKEAPDTTGSARERAESARPKPVGAIAKD